MKLLKKMFIFSLLLLLCLSGCGLVETQNRQQIGIAETGWFLYEINDSETDLVERPFQPSDTTGKKVLDELKAIVNGKTDVKLNLFPTGVILREYKLEQSILTLDFSQGYHDMSVIREILVRAALVRMFVQAPDVSAVIIQVDGVPISDSKGQEIGPMTSSTFTENMSKNLHSYRFVNMTLYFANKEGTALVPEERKLYYMSNLPLERVVVEQLIQGPAEKDRYATLSKDLKILSVVNSDGVCYINFDETFISDALSIEPQLTIYSIVNSVMDVCSVDKVHISISGDSNQTFRDMMDLNQFYEKNEELIQEINADEEAAS